MLCALLHRPFVNSTAEMFQHLLVQISDHPILILNEGWRASSSNLHQKFFPSSGRTKILLKHKIPLLPSVNEMSIPFRIGVYSNKHLVDFFIIGKLESVIVSDQTFDRHLSWTQGFRIAEIRRYDWFKSFWMAFVLVKPIKLCGNLSELSQSWRKPDFLWRWWPTLSCGWENWYSCF